MNETVGRGESAVERAFRRAHMMTSRDVYGRLGLVLFAWDMAKMKARAAQLDLNAEIERLRAELGKSTEVKPAP